MKKILRMTNLNYVRYKKISRKVIICLALSSVLFLFIHLFAQNSKKLYSNLNNNDDTLKIKVEGLASTNIINEISNLENIKKIDVSYTLETYGEDIEVTFEDKIMIQPRLEAAEPGYDYFYNKNHNNDTIISGRNFQKGDTSKVIIDENYVNALGFGNMDDILNKEIIIPSEKGDIKLDIIGVFNYKYGSHKYQKYINSELDDGKRENILRSYGLPVITSSDIIRNIDFGNDGTKIHQTLEVYANDVGNVLKLTNAIEEISKLEIINNYHEINIFLEKVKAIELLINIISIILFIITLIILINILITKIIEQQNLSKLMIKIGYTNTDITLIYVFENIISFIKAMFISLGMLLLITLVFDMSLIEFYKDISIYKKHLFLANPLDTIPFYLITLAFVIIISAVFTKISLIKHKIIR